jgi:Flp pilus assembly protein TadB
MSSDSGLGVGCGVLALPLLLVLGLVLIVAVWAWTGPLFAFFVFAAVCTIAAKVANDRRKRYRTES